MYEASVEARAEELAVIAKAKQISDETSKGNVDAIDSFMQLIPHADLDTSEASAAAYVGGETDAGSQAKRLCGFVGKADSSVACVGPRVEAEHRTRSYGDSNA